MANPHEANEENPVIRSNEVEKKQHKLYEPMRKAFAPVATAFGFLRKYTNITFWIVVGLIVGIIVGKFAPKFAVEIEPMGRVFLRMIQIIVGPLIFSTLVVGIAGHGDDLLRVGRLAVKSIFYFEVVTTFALIIGLLAVNIAKPGSGSNMEKLIAPDVVNKTITWVDHMESIVPQTFAGAMADHSAVLAIVFCAIMFSVAIMRADERSKKTMLAFNASLSAIMFKVVDLVMNYAPVGIACSLASTVGKYGLDSLASAGKLVGTLYVTLIIFAVLIFFPIILLCRVSLRQYLRAVGGPFVMAFATASSESVLPKAMEAMVAFGCPPEIVAFVIPTGYSFNLDGSTLHLALSSMYCAQVAGISKSVGEQIAMMLTLMLSSKGVAAVPRASYIVLLSTLTSANIPLAPLSLILGVDAFMDMARTSINVLGNMTACIVISCWEGEFRNEDWQNRQAGLIPETLAMDEIEEYSTTNHHSHGGHSLGGLHDEKASIHSVRSITSGAGHAHQRRQNNGDDIV